MTSFGTYTALVRQLDQHLTARAGDTASTAGQHATATAHLTDLRARTAEQATELTAGAQRLRYPRPHLDPAPPAPEPGTDPDLMLARAARAVDESERELARALHAATRPALMPDAPAPARHAVIYLTAAVLALVGQWTLIELGTDTFTIVAWSLFGIPALSYFTAIIAILLVSRTRIPSGGGGLEAVNRKTGAVICWSALPLSWVLLQLAHTVR